MKKIMVLVFRNGKKIIRGNRIYFPNLVLDTERKVAPVDRQLRKRVL